MAERIAEVGSQKAQVILQGLLQRAHSRAQVMVQQREQEQEQEAERQRQARQRYAEQRKVRQGWRAAQQFRHKAQLAMDAVACGEYPKPWATVAEAKAKRKEAEAQRRAAVQRQQVAKQVQQRYKQQDELWQAGQGRHKQANRYRSQDRSSLDNAMHALHKQVAAEEAERNAAAELQRAQEQENKAKQELAMQRRLQKLQAQQAQEQQQQEQFRQWQAQVQGQFDQWQEQQRAPAVAKTKAKAKKELARGLVPLTLDVNTIDSTHFIA